VPEQLSKHMNAADASNWFAMPLGQVLLYPPGTAQRDAAIDAYKHVQKILCIIGICLCIPLIFFACCIRNPVLGKEQSLPEAERRGEVVEGVAEGVDGGKKKGIFGFLKN
jgi:SIT family siderophore-iron:H+ symporter-like MFS transporter